VCDDRKELREAITNVLAHEPRFTVVAHAIDDVSCLQRVREVRPDVLILDVGMPGGGPDVARSAKLLHPGMHIMVFSGRQDARMQREMLLAGADQYVVKTGRVRPLLAALDRAFGGDDPAFGGDDSASGGDDLAFGGDDPALGGDDPALGGDSRALGGDDLVAGGDDRAFGGGEPGPGGGDRVGGTAADAESDATGG
jgi:CheY-like chemotaxis protein